METDILSRGIPLKQDIHVLYRIDRNPGFPYVTGNPGVIGVIPPMGWKVKSNRQPRLPRGEVSAVKSV